MGGEKKSIKNSRPFVYGSPPRGRGKGRDGTGYRLVQRITPAWAGKRKRLSSHGRFSRDHPRVGGEKRPCHPVGGFLAGSPPRGRGKGIVALELGVDTGITPAWAGKRAPIHLNSFCGRDHPRVGGEKQLLVVHHKQLRGSPPRGRGKVKTAAEAIAQDGITPAWAGKRYALTGSETAG